MEKKSRENFSQMCEPSWTGVFCDPAHWMGLSYVSFARIYRLPLPFDTKEIPTSQGNQIR